MTALIQAIETELATAKQRESDLQSELEQLDAQIEKLHKMRELAGDLDGRPSVPTVSKPETVKTHNVPAAPITASKPKRKSPTSRPTTAQIVALIKRDGPAIASRLSQQHVVELHGADQRLVAP